SLPHANRTRQLLAAPLLECGLVIEEVHLRGPARLEQPDHALRLGRKMRNPGKPREGPIVGHAIRAAFRPQQISVQQGSQDRCPYAGGIKAEEMSPRQQQAGIFPRVHCSLLGGHSLVMVSSRFRIRLAAAVYAASSAEFSFSSRPDFPWVIYWTAASGLSR